MKLFFLYFALSASSLALAFAVKQVLPKTIEQCTVENPPDLSMELYTTDDDELAFRLKASYDYDIDDNYKISYVSNILKNDEWVKQQDISDKWCQLIQLFTRPWNKARELVDPPLTTVADRCTIPAIKYEDIASLVQNQEVGTYKSEFRLYVEDADTREDVLCATVEYDIVN